MSVNRDTTVELNILFLYMNIKDQRSAMVVFDRIHFLNPVYFTFKQTNSWPFSKHLHK